MAFRFVTSQPALAPLFAAVGLGVGGSLAFATYYLSQNQDVVIRKRSHAEPWNQVQQGKNTKCKSIPHVSLQAPCLSCATHSGQTLF